MNYVQVYEAIINRAVNRENLTEAFDKHHIIPRSLGGTDFKSNIVKLTLREHFICHLLLAKIYGKGMLHAALMLSSFKRYNSRCYKWLREKYIDECMKGKTNPQIRFPWTEDQKKEIGEKSKGRKWVNNGNDSCMAKGEKLELLLTQGWKCGRLMTDTLKEGVKKGGIKTGGHNKDKPMLPEQKKQISETLKTFFKNQP